jgi:hypothetical protein
MKRCNLLGRTIVRNREQWLKAFWEVWSLTRCAKQKNWHTFIKSMKGKTSLSHVWSVIRSLNGKRLPPMARNTVLEHGGRSFVSDTAKADVFINHYASVSRHKFSRAERKVDRDVHIRLTEDSLNPEPLGPESDNFSMEELVSSLKVGKAKGAEGPDRLAPQFLKNFGEVANSFMLDTFNKSWRDAVLVSILKPGKPQGQLDSYRPLALTSCLSKMMERIVAKRFQHLAESCGMLNSDQSGFCPQRSTEDQVIRLSQAISDGFQAKKPPNRIVLALLDFSKAYNKVWRADLLATILRKGVPVRYVRWIQGFLSNRQARVRLNRAYSQTWAMREGVPQGSVLAPLLFLFVIDDLQDCLPEGVHSSLFADDSALWVHSPRKEEAVPVLQEGVREVYRWARAKKLTLNLKK